MKKLLFSLVCAVAIVGAVDNGDGATSAGNGRDYGQQRAGVGDNTFKSTEAVNIQEKGEDADVQDNTYAVIYGHLKAYENLRKQSNQGGVTSAVNSAGGVPNATAAFDFYADKQKKDAVLVAQRQEEAQKELLPQYLFMDGYCSIPNEVKIARIAGYADLNCDLSVNKRATLKVALTPDFYSKSLIATPLYVNLDGKRYTIVAGAVTNALRTSINVATEVDDYLVSRILADTGAKSASIVTQYAQEYLDERRSYRESKNNSRNHTYTTTPGGTVVISEKDSGKDAPPKMGDYLGGALVEIVGGLIGSASNAYLQSRTYSFKIDRKTVLFADLQINLNEQSIKGINFQPANMIAQQPSTNFDDSDPTSGIDYPAVGIGALENDGNGNKQSENGATSTRQKEESVARRPQGTTTIQTPPIMPEQPQQRRRRSSGSGVILNGGYGGTIIDTRNNGGY